MKMRTGLLIFLSVAMADTALGEVFVRLGSEFQINTYTTGRQEGPRCRRRPAASSLSYGATLVQAIQDSTVRMEVIRVCSGEDSQQPARRWGQSFR